MSQHFLARFAASVFVVFLLLAAAFTADAQGTRLLRQPTISSDHVAFAHGGDLWVAGRAGGEARRLTSTPAVEQNPRFSPDGRLIAFTSNRSGVESVYVLPVEGGDPTRLTWYPAASYALGWTPDGSRVLYASSRETAPAAEPRRWTRSPDGGPSEWLPAPRGHDGSLAGDGSRIVVDRVARWDPEWRRYRGGQNKPLVILDLSDLSEAALPNDRSVDLYPIWMDERIYFVSDRDWSANIYSYDPSTGEVNQLTDYDDVDVKWLAGHDGSLVFERDGWIFALDTATGEINKIEITVNGDFPWADTRWEDVSGSVRGSSLSATGVRAVFEARGEIFTVPVEKGDSRNLSRSSGAADRAPIWSPDGSEIAWFSDSGEGYELLIAGQDGLSEPRRLSIGESKMAWEPVWSPDGSQIAFVDDDTRVRVINLESGEMVTADTAGANIDRGSMGLSWSPDSKWLAYAKAHPNNFHRIVVWSAETSTPTPLTNALADAVSPSWDRGGRYLYFLASTDLALASGWANTSTMQADPSYAAYAIVLRADDPTPFVPESDEEPVKEDKPEGDDDDEAGDEEKKVDVTIDFQGIERRTLALKMPEAPYVTTVPGPEGRVIVGEDNPDGPGMTLHKFTL